MHTFALTSLLNNIVNMSQNESRNTENLILEAAESEFLEKGFELARTMSIAQRAGVTHAMLHYYFRTKEQLFQKVVEQKFQLIADMVLVPFSSSELPVKERLTQGIGAHFDLLMKNPQLSRFLVSESDRLAPILKDVILPKAIPVMMSLQNEIDMDVRMLLLDILSQNLFAFIFHPVLEKAGFADQGTDAFMEQIKQENITIILKRLGL
jgi:AcrR family transcriptional regulator